MHPMKDEYCDIRRSHGQGFVCIGKLLCGNSGLSCDFNRTKKVGITSLFLHDEPFIFCLSKHVNRIFSPLFRNHVPYIVEGNAARLWRE